ncbi:hypothetical protein [Saccharopolyspora soli]|nr:hypothetical protein [Saccharopolyspora soli]
MYIHSGLPAQHGELGRGEVVQGGFQLLRDESGGIGAHREAEERGRI